MLFAAVFNLSACGLFDSLEDGVYVVDRIYLNGSLVGENHAIRRDLAAANAQWAIDGRNATFSHPLIPGFPPIQAQSSTVEYRIREGYFEQRSEELTNNLWTRENGSRQSAYTSTRVENNEIVIRYGTNSNAGQHFNGSVYIFYALQGE